MNFLDAVIRAPRRRGGRARRRQHRGASRGDGRCGGPGGGRSASGPRTSPSPARGPTISGPVRLFEPTGAQTHVLFSVAGKDIVALVDGSTPDLEWPDPVRHTSRPRTSMSSAATAASGSRDMAVPDPDLLRCRHRPDHSRRRRSRRAGARDARLCPRPPGGGSRPGPRDRGGPCSGLTGLRRARRRPAATRRSARVEESDWFRQLVELTAEGFWADPGNGGNRDARSWAMIGYRHGLPEGPSGPSAPEA